MISGHKKIKIMTVVGTRPEIIKLSRIIAKLDHYTDQILVHTGQNYDYELNEIFFKDFGIRKPDYFLKASGINAAKTIGNVISAIDNVLDKEKPDAFLVLGDTNSCLSSIAAKKRKIPIFHIEAGNRCFDQRVPEEMNRKLVDHIADINLTYSAIAREYLLREGVSPDRIIKIGSPMLEIIQHGIKNIESSDILKKLNLTPKSYFVCSVHREENIDDEENFLDIVHSIKTIADLYDMKIIFSVHPRTRKKIEVKKIKLGKNVVLLNPLGFHNYLKLQMSAFAVLSDSGTITEESSILNFPAINLREVHERPEGFEEAAVMMTGLKSERMIQAIEILKAQPRGEQRLLKMIGDYDVDNVSDKVIRIILSYIDYIKQNVWKIH